MHESAGFECDGRNVPARHFVENSAPALDTIDVFQELTGLDQAANGETVVWVNVNSTCETLPSGNLLVRIKVQEPKIVPPFLVARVTADLGLSSSEPQLDR